MTKDIYKITVLGWNKHNSKKRKGHEYILLSTRFLDDAKIRILPQGGKLLYLSLLLSCGDDSSNTIRASYDQLVTNAGGKGQRVSILLEQLKELQLVTYEKIPSLIIKNVIKNISKNVKEEHNRQVVSKPPDPVQEKLPEIMPEKGTEKLPRSASPPSPDGTNEVIARYCELWKELYKGQAPIGGRVAGQFKTLVKDHGKARSIQFVESYFSMKETWFVKKRHDVATLLASLNAVAHFAETGKIISGSDLRRLDTLITNQNTLEAARRGEV